MEFSFPVEFRKGKIENEKVLIIFPNAKICDFINVNKGNRVFPAEPQIFKGVLAFFADFMVDFTFFLNKFPKERSKRPHLELPM